ncbi:hypothetical protein S2M10_29660 [Sphingomonas sp. S2M10]|uniref:hypothetical protein n=1 Tax=Sphingomonas sp. S2M10 TaxID=2705010 RepID=UPI0014571297|nr:hypothetical protein [Sphingomonas sp. S2M10]NLS27964.1 hypothetical protein [Sphingomonas sp. S2M10]
MAARRYVCKRRGCDRARERWQDVCSGCWQEVPQTLRDGLRQARERGLPALARQIGQNIVKSLGRKPARAAGDARAAYYRTAAMMGERAEIEPAE